MATSASDFETALADTAASIEAVLGRLLSATPAPGELHRPDRLAAAMRHAALGGGKRIRPFLLVETARMFGRTGEGPLRAGAALECIHCYSLVHDDLPAMDDDDLRRGKPTVHIAFDEATAILAGDALLTIAFDIVADPATEPDPAIRAELCLRLARAAGVGGMAGGQMLDLAAEGERLDEPAIRRLQAMKTGALLKYPCEAGALIGRATAAELAALSRFGAAIGLAFQLADDLLDITGDTATLGKAAGKDAEAGKATLPGLLGVERARDLLRREIAAAEEILVPFGARGARLRECARFIGERQG